MTPVGVVVTLTAAAMNTGIAIADFVQAPFVLANSHEVGVPRRWLPVLGSLKLAGATGLIAGLLGVDALGATAAAGLTLFFVGAVVAHVRARVFHNIAFPLAFLAAAVGALTVA